LYNAACLAALGFEGCRQSSAVHADVVALVLGHQGAQAVLVLVMISALGAVNGTIFTAARLYAAMGADHRLFAPLGAYSARLQTPACSLLVQAAISMAMIVGVGLLWRGSDGFDLVVSFTAPVFWLFFLLTGVSVFVLRARDWDVERPFRVPLYPLL